MPTNLKSLLSRSRSRNELKSRKGEENGSPELSNEMSSNCNPSGHCCCDLGVNVTKGGGQGPVDFSSLTMRRDVSSKSFFSCSALHGVGLGGMGLGNEETTTCLCNRQTTSSSNSDTGTCSSSSCCSCCINSRDSCQSLSIRKCKTVLALSSFGGGGHQNQYSPSSSCSSPSSSSGMATCSGATLDQSPMETHLDPLSTTTATTTSSSSGRVKLMKDKILSTSSSTLNSLIHSSSRTTSKLFSGWKFANNASNTNHLYTTPNSNTNHCVGNSNNSVTTMTNNLTPPVPSMSINIAAPTPSMTNYPFSNSSHISQLSSSGGVGGGMMTTGSKSKSQLSISDVPLTPVNRLRRHLSVTNSSAGFCTHPNDVCDLYSRSSSVASFHWKDDPHQNIHCEVFCRLCLSNYKYEDTVEVLACSCRYCKDCLTAYVSFEIQEGAYEIACPDASCDKEGVISMECIESLVPKPLVDKHRKFRLYREVDKDGQLMWCQSPGCETVCKLTDVSDKVRPGCSTVRITCTTCSKSFCAECKLSWHPETSCEAFRRKLIKQGKLNVDDEDVTQKMDSIKKCPFCRVPIEKDSGCAQMMCKRCKHVFCWYCLASLDDDFLLRHYDKGPCKNKLGHSRASVVWHRAQVIGIFAGFGILILLASPVLMLLAPCLLCCRCRYCANKLDPEDPIPL